MRPIRDWFKSLTSNDPRTATRRKSPPLVAYFWDGGSPVAHSIKNISPTGFFLETTERWLLGTLVMMTLQRTGSDPDLANCTIIVMSKVIRHGEDGVGFCFILVDNPASERQPGPISQPADRKTLDKFLELINSDQDYLRLD
ncbi:MAG TPA: PilZ domain-containing protein [Acidobacteriaceae bacterium]|nr:PilZ domain-containing protein [Acidobacteriaceae bacterium]